MTLQNILCRIDHLLQTKVVFNGVHGFNPETGKHHNIINAGINEVDRIIGAEVNSINAQYGASSERIKSDIIKSFIASELNESTYPGDNKEEKTKVDAAFHPIIQAGIKERSKRTMSNLKFFLKEPIKSALIKLHTLKNPNEHEQFFLTCVAGKFSTYFGRSIGLRGFQLFIEKLDIDLA